ncbi:MAG: ribonuclease P protein component [Acidimicrobiia bacterium]
MRSFVSLTPGSRFRDMYRSAPRRRSGGITVLQARGESVTPHVGVVAGKSVGNAVQRNRAKRRLREAANKVDLESHTAYVVIASRDVLGVQFGELLNWFAAAIAVGNGEGDKDT